MGRHNGNEFRHRVSQETIQRAATATPEEAWQIMLEFWTGLVQWCARHGIAVRTAAEIFARGIGCPVHKLPWVWDRKLRELRCPRYPECGCVIVDRNDPDPEVARSLAEDRREERTQMHMPKTIPVYGEPKGEEVGHPKKPS